MSIKLDDKYEFYEEPEFSLKCKRYGEPWRDFVGDKAVYALFKRAEELQEHFAAQRVVVAERNAVTYWVQSGSKEPPPPPSIPCEYCGAALASVYTKWGSIEHYEHEPRECRAVLLLEKEAGRFDIRKVIAYVREVPILGVKHTHVAHALEQEFLKKDRP